jgi:ubiquinone/menaquinone biosynthesis C-methylase UbiE
MELHQAHVRYTAEEYDRYTADFVKPFDESLTACVLEESAGRPPGAVLLDVGAGTARFLVKLASVPELESLRLIGTDLFPDMVEQARTTIEAANCASRIEMYVSDAHDMEFPDEFADLIVSRSTLHHWHTPAKALREMDRILKPGGVAIIQDIRRDAVPEAIAAFNRMREAANISSIGPSYLEEKFTADEVRQFLREAGVEARGIVRAPQKGLGALGLAVEIRKPPG